ncbi:hypothetical protein B566_EDAN004282 [Ephemera danica]|nr:hypothetical protein B566_EDAN004282 [Ephemera danica]
MKKYIISSTGFSQDEKERVKHIVEVLGGRYTGYLTKENKILICRKTEGSKFQQARLWHTTVVNAHWLHDVMQGHFRALHATSFVKYQQYNLENPFALDYNQMSHLMMAWKVPVSISQECLERGKLLQQQQQLTGKPARRRTLSPNRAAMFAQEEAENRVERPSKRAKVEEVKTESESTMVVRVLLSLVKDKQESKRQIAELGGTMARSFDEATHLVMGDAQRTVKLLCALPFVKNVVREDWLTDSYVEKRFLETDKYIFNDTDLEQRHNFTFRSLLQKPNRTQLFKDVTFYVSPGVIPSLAVLEDVIVASGGRVERQRRGAPRIIEQNRARPNSYIVLASTNDLHLLVELINARIDIYCPEMIFSSLLQQKLDLDEKYKLVQ